MSEKEDLLNNLKIDRSEEPSSSEGAKNKFTLLAAAVVIVVAFFWFFNQEEEITEVTTFTVKSLSNSDSPSASILDASGYVVPRTRATVSSKITGKVMEVFIEEGMYVKKGQILAQLDDSSAVAELNYSISQLDEARRVFERTKELTQDQLASQAALDAAEATLKGLEALTEVRRQLVRDMKIIAPFSGVVVYKAAQPGEMISPVSAGGGFTKTGICTIVDMDSLEIEVDVNESFINRVKAGQPVVANLNAYPKWDIPAEVIAIVPTADRNKATVRVRIGLLEKDERVLPDMGTRVSFLEKIEKKENEIKKEGVMVPLASVESKDGVSYILLVVDQRVKLVEVIIAETTENYARITSGISSGDKVIAKFDKSLGSDHKVIVN